MQAVQLSRSLCGFDSRPGALQSSDPARSVRGSTHMTVLRDHERLVKALRHLAPRVQRSTDRAWSREPALRVIDCVLSLNRNYDLFVVPRLNRFERDFPEIHTVNDLRTKIAAYLSPDDFVRTTLDYNHEARAVTLANVTNWLARISGRGTRDQELIKLEQWAKNASPHNELTSLNIRGFGLAGFQYMRMLFGANTTKPDIRICEWTAQAIGHPVSPLLALRLLEQAAPEAGVSLRDVDTTIWETLARGSHPLHKSRLPRGRGRGSTAG